MHYVVDVEAMGQYPAKYAMCSIGIVAVERNTYLPNERTVQGIYRELIPDSREFEQGAIEAHGLTFEYLDQFGEDPVKVMTDIEQFIKKTSSSGGRPVLWSDNNSFDVAFVNHYMWKYLGRSIFGYSSRRIGDFYCGLVKNPRANRNWKRKYRITNHTHNAYEDALGNAEALSRMLYNPHSIL